MILFSDSSRNKQICFYKLAGSGKEEEFSGSPYDLGLSLVSSFAPRPVARLGCSHHSPFSVTVGGTTIDSGWMRGLVGLGDGTTGGRTQYLRKRDSTF
jgi:hypothetical protein